METFKIKVRETIEAEKELQLPYFCKSGPHHYMVINTKKCIAVYSGYDKDERRIQTSHAGLPFDIDGDHVEITENEFRTAMDNAMIDLISLSTILPEVKQLEEQAA